MGNPQTNALNRGAKQSNTHVSGRFAGLVNVSEQNDDEHPSTLHSPVNTTSQFKSQQPSINVPQPEPPKLEDNLNETNKPENSKFFKEKIAVTSQKSDDIYSGKSKYISDPQVINNLNQKKEVNELFDMKTLMVLALIILVFIFILPFMYDIINTF